MHGLRLPLAASILAFGCYVSTPGQPAVDGGSGTGAATASDTVSRATNSDPASAGAPDSTSAGGGSADSATGTGSSGSTGPGDELHRCEPGNTITVELAESVDQADANLAALHQAAAEYACLRVETPGAYPIADAFEPDHNCRDVFLAAGVELVQYGDAHVVHRRGRTGTRHTVTQAIAAGSDVIALDDAGTVRPSDWLFVQSDDPIRHDGKSKAGALRQVTGVAGNDVTLDRALHRTMAQDPVAVAVELAPSLRLHGEGTLRFADPGANQWRYIVFWQLVEEPRIEGLTLRDGGASGVNYFATVGGHSRDVYVRNLIDDHDASGWIDISGTEHTNETGYRHYGYGHEAAAGARDLVIEGGEVRWVRHAFTTNHGTRAPTPLTHAGEPENIVFAVDVVETTSSAINTHEGGWNIEIRDLTITRPGRYWAMGVSNDGKEDGSAIFIRNNRARVHDITISDGPERAIGTESHLAPELEPMTPHFENIVITGYDGKCFHTKTPMTVQNITAACGNVGLHVQGRITGDNVTLEGPMNIGVLVGPGVQGSHLTGIQGADIANPVTDNSGNDSNSFEFE